MKKHGPYMTHNSISINKDTTYSRGKLYQYNGCWCLGSWWIQTKNLRCVNVVKWHKIHIHMLSQNEKNTNKHKTNAYCLHWNSPYPFHRIQVDWNTPLRLFPYMSFSENKKLVNLKTLSLHCKLSYWQFTVPTMTTTFQNWRFLLF